MAIVSATRNMFLISIGTAIRTALRFQFNLSAERKMFPASQLDKHRLICKAILARKGEIAASHMLA